jgi:hypothetical protein
VREAKTCPACGFLLRYEDPADASFSAVRYILVEMLQWGALALFLAFLWAPAESLALRRRQSASAAALLERRRYYCAQCKRDYAARDLTARGP